MTALELGLSRQNDSWSEGQLGQPEANEPIYVISGETYFLHPTNDWAYSSSSMQVIDNRVDTQIRLRQPLCEKSAIWPAPSRNARTCSACRGK